MKNDVLSKIRVLRDLTASDRDDEVVEGALNYILSYSRAKLENESEITGQEIEKFEKKYGLSSRKFMMNYKKGTAADSIDYVEWFALISLKLSFDKKLSLIESVMSD
ncbi:MAG: hypothetical protein KAR07_04005 [Spirochaetes bacterium]|nr:hypothetical protein [Spirochaetota bacterium]